MIYDGPFSDHILEKEPLMLKGQQEFSQERALEKAIRASGNTDLGISEEEGGKMPSYVFTEGSTTVSVTKHGYCRGLFGFAGNRRLYRHLL